MMRSEKVSVIINNYNYGEYLEEAFKSVLAQSYAVDEILIIDDGSTDDSYSIALELTKDVANASVVQQENEGQTGAIFNALKLCKYDIVAMLDSDDSWRENHIEEAMAVMTEHQLLGMYYSNYQEFGETSKTGHRTFNKGYMASTFYITALRRCFIGNITSALVFRKKSIIEGLDLPTKFVGDWRSSADNILIWLASFSGMHKYESDSVTVNYRIHNSNVTRSFGDRTFRGDRERHSVQLFHYFSDAYYVPFVRARDLFTEYRGHRNKTIGLKKLYISSVLCRAKDVTILTRIGIGLRMLFY